MPLLSEGTEDKATNRKRKGNEKRRINYINHDINSSSEKISPYGKKTSSSSAAKKKFYVL
jgi:hypothetical protein